MSPGRQGSVVAGILCALCVTISAGLAPVAVADERVSVNDQLGSQLREVRGGSDAAIAAARQADVTISRAEKVLVQVNVEGPVAVSAATLASEGMQVSATADEPIPVVEGWIPAAELAEFTKLPGVTAILPVLGGGTDAGAAMSQGVAAHHIPQATAAGAGTGAGVDLGVISDSIDQVGGGIADSQATGDLPAGAAVSVIKDDPVLPTDEGRAMAEIIYDGAPSLNRIVFASGTASGPADKADSINQLVANGVDIIADDIFWMTEPFFQDGVVAQAVDAARAAGVTYFASAGNRARQSYEATYSDSAGFHDFDPGPGADTIQTLASVPSGRFIQVTLNWDESWGAATSNFNISLVQTNGSPLPCTAPSGGQDNNPVTGLPREVVTWTNCGGGSMGVALKIQRVPGTAASPFMKYIARGNFGAFSISEFATNSDTINPDAASANGAITVAAVSATDPGNDTPESYSSRGPKTRLFNKDGVRLASPETRLKPEVAAADAVATTVPGFTSFSGTSASVPSAASIAANLISTNPSASPTEIRTQMTAAGNSIECTLSILVPDPDCGAGFLLADGAAAALDRTGPVVVPVLAPAAPNGSNGWYVSGVNVAWNPTDAESPIESTTCAPVTDSSDGIESFSCDATSGGGTSSGSVEVKRDTVVPAVPKITGIKARKYKLRGKAKTKLPPLGKIRCKSSDATSGLASCRITGYKRKPGKRTLTATATDNAGLKSVRKLKIKVVR